jgi:hypothetical protein
VSRAEFVAILETLAAAMRADLDAPTLSAYYRALKDIPASLLEGTVDRLLREPLTFFPKAGEVRAACEKQRRAVLALHPYDGCADCEHSKGFRLVIVAGGQATVQVCPCKSRHLELLTTLGISTPIVMLAGEPDGTNEQVYPTVEQLPAPLRAQLLEQVKQKVLR